MGVDMPRVSSVSEAMEIGSAREQNQHALFADLVRKASKLGPVPYAAVWPCEQHALQGVVDAAARGILTPVLVVMARPWRPSRGKAGWISAG